jgi:hypothetical protein
MKNTAKSLRRSAISKFIMQTPEVKEKHKQSIVKRQSDPTYHKKRNSALQEKYKDPIWKENIQKGADKRHADPAWQKAWRESYTPESNKRRSESCKKALNTPGAKAKASAHATALWEKEEHRIKIQKCVKTILGVFPSCKEAAMAHGKSVANFGTSMKRKKNIQAGWCIITREEYELLKGI